MGPLVFSKLKHHDQDQAPYQRHDGATSVTTPEQLKLPHSAATSAPEQPKQAPEQARLSHNVIASTGANYTKIEGLDNDQRIMSHATKSKQLKECTSLSKD